MISLFFDFLRRTVASIAAQNQHLKVIQTFCKIRFLLLSALKAFAECLRCKKDYPSSSYVGLSETMAASSDLATEASYFQPLLPGDHPLGTMLREMMFCQ